MTVEFDQPNLWTAKSSRRGGPPLLVHAREQWPDGWPMDKGLCGALPASGWTQASGASEVTCKACKALA